MAASPSSPATLEPTPETSEPEKPVQSIKPDPAPPASSHLSSSAGADSAPSYSLASAAAVLSNPPPPLSLISPPPPAVQSFASSTISAGIIPPSAPSFRLVNPIPVPTPQFTHLANQNAQNPIFQNPNFNNPNVQPPGSNPVSVMLPGVASGAGAVSISVSPLPPPGTFQLPPGQLPNHAVRPYPQMHNGFLTMSAAAPPGTIPPPGIPRYPTPYTTMVRPPFPLRPPGAVGVLPPLSRPPIPGIRGVPSAVPPVVRPIVPIVAPTEKPQTTVYVGKISSTVENDFMLSLLQLCGTVKSWKRAQDPTDGTPRGFGFCEFDSAEGVLRALRLLSKFNIDGQELVGLKPESRPKTMVVTICTKVLDIKSSIKLANVVQLNVNQATREYLERYVEKKTEREKLKETGSEGIERDEERAPGVEKTEYPKPSVEESKKDENDSGDRENQDSTNFGIVTDEDREADRDALEKLTSMIEERLKTKPLPPPPPPPHTPADGSGRSNSEAQTKSRDGDSDIDIMKSDAAEDKNDDETTSENKRIGEHDKPETSSPDRSRRSDRRSKERDRDRDLKRDKERELERYERERERERVRRERERELKIREAERLYKECVKEWESREREKEYQRKHDREREKERERERRREIMDQEDESDDDARKRRRRSSVYEEKRKKRQREMEEDLADRLREEEEIAEAKRRAIEEQQQKQKDEPKVVSSQVTNGSDEVMFPEETNLDSKDTVVEKGYESDSANGNRAGDVISINGISNETAVVSMAASDVRESNNVPARKLGFGLVGSGKRTAVPSVFYQEDDDEAQKEKKMRPLVPIDYSVEELQVTQPTVSGPSTPSLAAAAEYAKHISNVNAIEERPDAERERHRRTNDRSSHGDRDRYDERSNRSRSGNREKNLDRDKDREHGVDKLKIPENKKLLDAKQLIDMIPKTKEELFSYEINWAIYDKYELHERMKPWISKKITEFLGEEEASLVDYIVSSTRNHEHASQMLDMLQSILDDEAEMFVLKMWRMLIFEIKKVETGISVKPKA